VLDASLPVFGAFTLMSVIAFAPFCSGGSCWNSKVGTLTKCVFTSLQVVCPVRSLRDQYTIMMVALQAIFSVLSICGKRL